MASGIELLYFSRRSGGQLVLIQFPHAFAHVVREHEVEEGLLLGVEVCADLDLGHVGSLVASQFGERVGDESPPMCLV